VVSVVVDFLNAVVAAAAVALAVLCLVNCSPRWNLSRTHPSALMFSLPGFPRLN